MTTPLTQENLRKATATSNNTRKTTTDPFEVVCREVRTFLKTEGNKAKRGAFVYFEYLDDPDDPVCIWGDANDGRPRWVEYKERFFWPHQEGYPRPAPPTPPPPPPKMGLSPIICLDTPPSPQSPTPPPQPPPTPPKLGFSPIRYIDTPPSRATTPQKTGRKTTSPPPAPTTPTRRKRKTRKGKTTPSPVPKSRTPAPASPPATPTPTNPATAPAPATPKPHPRSTPPKDTRKITPPTPPTTKAKVGLVIHGVALRRELGNVRRWLSEDNKDMPKITGIRWLRKKDILVGEGKKTSSIVVYLEEDLDKDKVRLGGKWLKACRYDTERGRR